MNAFQPWIKRFPPSGPGRSAAVVFAHAGGAAAAYRPLANTLSANGIETFLVQYPRRAERLTHPAPATIGELAEQLYAAGDWHRLARLQLFGHCMGATVAFEFARLAEADGVDVRRLWASAGPAPCTIAGAPPLPSTDADVLADLVDLGGTDPRLLEDEDFAELLLLAVHTDYRALDRYSCSGDIRIDAGIRALGGARDHRVSGAELRRWGDHTTGDFSLTFFDGGHFYLADHLDDIATMMSAE